MKPEPSTRDWLYALDSYANVTHGRPLTPTPQTCVSCGRAVALRNAAGLCAGCEAARLPTRDVLPFNTKFRKD